MSDFVMIPNDLNILRDAVYKDAVAHGLYEEYESFYKHYPAKDAYWGKRWECAARIDDEAKEALGAADDAYDRAMDVDDAEANAHYAEELADVIITTLSVCGYLGIDIHTAVIDKIRENKLREWKHGKA